MKKNTEKKVRIVAIVLAAIASVSAIGTVVGLNVINNNKQKAQTAQTATIASEKKKTELELAKQQAEQLKQKKAEQEKLQMAQATAAKQAAEAKKAAEVKRAAEAKKAEAEALLAGIVLDTKSFSLRTGERTFDAASWLRRCGADTSEIKKLFQIDMDTALGRYKLMQNAKLYRGVAITVSNEPQERIVAAQAADELLGIENVKASFVMYKTGKTTNISARSLGDLNVQVIMEQLGGGGHQTMAACQLENTGIAEAREKRVSIISELDVSKEDSNS